MLYHPIKSIGSNFTNLQMSLLAMERVFAKLASIPVIHNCAHPKALKGIHNSIKFDHVFFEYEAGRPVLKNINLEVHKGKTIALVGNSGGGKSTFVSLLPRFYDVTEGQIRINGQDIRRYTLHSLREQMSVVFQDNYLFAGTIRENIMLGKKDASEEELQQAVQAAYVDAFLKDLPEGLDTQRAFKRRAKTAYCHCARVFEKCSDCYFGRSNFGAGQ